ncbi:DUF3644 domain-containing protein [Nocardioides sp.]|uniref:DUF3644 domain-containing protein n=1 Tax=Nocardioides sp. TaxID=35761 RepID=UPI00321BE27F
MLKAKALASLVVATTAFNSPHDRGRHTQVLLALQHSFEMLLKAALVQTGTSVFDKRSGRSKSFDNCLNLARSSAKITLSEEDAGTLRAIDAMRDDEQHWFNEVSEQMLYIHARAAVTLFDELLFSVFEERLANHIPERVLPISTDPPKDLTLLLDDEYRQIGELLRPGRRAGHEARARIRTLLAMEGHVRDELFVSSRDVDRVERGVKNGNPRSEVFPRLEELATRLDGEGLAVTVHFTKKDGAPVRFEPDETTPAAAIRQVDLQAKYHLSATQLAEKVGLSSSRATALRRHLLLDDNSAMSHEFAFGKSKHRSFSDNALRLMRPLAGDRGAMEKIWAAHKPTKRSSPAPPCEVPGCRAAAD